MGRKAHAKRRPALDIASFAHFAPLLEACQEYARLTGCRFHGLSYEACSLEHLRGTLSEGDLVLSASGAAPLVRLGPRLAAELRAAPALRAFEGRLRRGEPGLLADLETAAEIMMGEGVRNSLRVTCRQLGLWPPLPTPEGVDADDCSYHDTRAGLPVVAQRLYNDERRRSLIVAGAGGVDLEHARAATASFLLDFAHEAGVPLPAMPVRHEALLKGFAASVAAWEAQRCEGEALEQCWLDGCVYHGYEDWGYEDWSYECESNEDWTAADVMEAAGMVRSDIKRWLDRALQMPAFGDRPPP